MGEWGMFRRRLEEVTKIAALPGMVRWYSPQLLVSTAFRSFVSGIFGQFADQRVMQAAVDGFSPEIIRHVIARYDYSNRLDMRDGDAVWVDYVADAGDGFDSTYSIASLIAADTLEVEGAGALPGAKLLIMGGDQVYPYPTRQAYQDRLVTPYDLARPKSEDPADTRNLFVLPGNHDWYDGLNSFDFMFCKARYGLASENRIGGWTLPQHRSYFAIQLPNNWWIWGADIQLSQYLDAGQVLYFRSVAEAMKRAGGEPKVILCIAEPTWNYTWAHDEDGGENLALIIRIASEADARIAAVLAGDLHHYSRYHAAGPNAHFITSGGGGAYFSPTHVLADQLRLKMRGETHRLDLKCQIKDGAPTGKAACWPSRLESRGLGLSVLGFPLRNYGFAMCLGAFYWLMTWLFSTTSFTYNGLTRDGTQWLVDGRASIDWLRDSVPIVLLAGANNVALGLLSLVLWLILYSYAEARKSTLKKVLIGTAHWLAHIAAMIALFVGLTLGIRWFLDTGLSGLFGWTLIGEQARLATILLYPAAMILIGGLGAGLVWALYLLVCCLFGVHCDETFSSMAIPGYKNFLRFKIEPERLTIYPIGLRHVPPRILWREAKPGPDGKVAGPRYQSYWPLKPQLIDGPIVVDMAEAKSRARIGEKLS